MATPACYVCGEDCPEGVTVLDVQVVHKECDTFGAGYEAANKDAGDLAARVAELEGLLAAQAEEHAEALESRYRVGLEDGKIEGRREAKDTNRRLVERDDDIERLQGLLKEAQDEAARLGGVVENEIQQRKDASHRATTAETERDEAKAATATLTTERDRLRSELRHLTQQRDGAHQTLDAETGRLEAELAAATKQGAEFKRKLEHLEAQIPPAIVRQAEPAWIESLVRQWLAPVPWQPSEYDFRALRELAAEGGR